MTTVETNSFGLGAPAVSEDVATLLARFANVINESGLDSDEVRRFIDHHASNEEFRNLAELAMALKRELSVASRV
jgi:hypothetical protein